MFIITRSYSTKINFSLSIKLFWICYCRTSQASELFSTWYLISFESNPISLNEISEKFYNLCKTKFLVEIFVSSVELRSNLRTSDSPSCRQQVGFTPREEGWQEDAKGEWRSWPLPAIKGFHSGWVGWVLGGGRRGGFVGGIAGALLA